MDSQKGILSAILLSVNARLCVRTQNNLQMISKENMTTRIMFEDIMTSIVQVTAGIRN